MIGFVGVIERNDGVITIVRVYGRKDKAATIQTDSTAMLQSVSRASERQARQGPGQPLGPQGGSDEAERRPRHRAAPLALSPSSSHPPFAVQTPLVPGRFAPGQPARRALGQP